jgi:hypothetical protein
MNDVGNPELDAKACAWMAFCKGLATMGNRDAGEHKAVFEAWWQCYGRKDADHLIGMEATLMRERRCNAATEEIIGAERDLALERLRITEEQLEAVGHMNETNVRLDNELTWLKHAITKLHGFVDLTDPNDPVGTALTAVGLQYDPCVFDPDVTTQRAEKAEQLLGFSREGVTHWTKGAERLMAERDAAFADAAKWTAAWFELAAERDVIARELDAARDEYDQYVKERRNHDATREKLSEVRDQMLSLATMAATSAAKERDQAAATERERIAQWLDRREEIAARAGTTAEDYLRNVAIAIRAGAHTE